MREIKYRAFKKTNTPEMFNDLAFIDFKNREIGINYRISFLAHRIDVEDINNVVLMQFTGLKDKNGVEIYEGDIVRVCDGVDSYVTDVYFGGEEYPAFDLNYEHIPGMWFYESNVLSTINNTDTEEIEVIGNIYENLELLGG